jgi:hypothetical protein
MAKAREALRDPRVDVAGKRFERCGEPDDPFGSVCVLEPDGRHDASMFALRKCEKLVHRRRRARGGRRFGLFFARLTIPGDIRHDHATNATITALTTIASPASGVTRNGAIMRPIA